MKGKVHKRNFHSIMQCIYPLDDTKDGIHSFLESIPSSEIVVVGFIGKFDQKLSSFIGQFTDTEDFEEIVIQNNDLTSCYNIYASFNHDTNALYLYLDISCEYLHPINSSISEIYACNKAGDDHIAEAAFVMLNSCHAIYLVDSVSRLVSYPSI